MRTCIHRTVAASWPPLALFFFAAFLIALMTGTSPAKAANMVVYKSPTCGCCKYWIGYMRRNGHLVKTQNLDDLDVIKKMAGVPEFFQSCHTALVDD